MTDTKQDKSYKLLLVEDDPADALLIRERVKDIWPNVKIISVESLSDAYETYEEQEFDMVLLDLNLPDGYGGLTVEEMRRLSTSVPIVVLTGLGTNKAVEDALRLGANQVALKSNIMDDDFANILRENILKAS